METLWPENKRQESANPIQGFASASVPSLTQQLEISSTVGASNSWAPEPNLSSIPSAFHATPLHPFLSSPRSISPRDPSQQGWSGILQYAVDWSAGSFVPQDITSSSPPMAVPFPTGDRSLQSHPGPTPFSDLCSVSFPPDSDGLVGVSPSGLIQVPDATMSSLNLRQQPTESAREISESMIEPYSSQNMPRPEPLRTGTLESGKDPVSCVDMARSARSLSARTSNPFDREEEASTLPMCPGVQTETATEGSRAWRTSSSTVSSLPPSRHTPNASYTPSSLSPSSSEPYFRGPPVESPYSLLDVPSRRGSLSKRTAGAISLCREFPIPVEETTGNTQRGRHNPVDTTSKRLPRRQKCLKGGQGKEIQRQATFLRDSNHNYLCPLLCGKTFTRSHDIGRHINTGACPESQYLEHAALFRCGACETGYSRKDALIRHYKSEAHKKQTKKVEYQPRKR